MKLPKPKFPKLKSGALRGPSVHGAIMVATGIRGRGGAVTNRRSGQKVPSRAGMTGLAMIAVHPVKVLRRGITLPGRKIATSASRSSPARKVESLRTANLRMAGRRVSGLGRVVNLRAEDLGRADDPARMASPASIRTATNRACSGM